MAESAKKKAGRASVAAVPDHAHADPRGTAPAEEPVHREKACAVPLCPICTAVELLRPLNPEVLEHLMKAGREFLLAAKAALDAVTTTPETDGEDPLEKIDIG